MITLAMATLVAAPREVVWRALADPEQEARWRPGVTKTLLAAAGAPEPGRTLRLRCLFQGVPVVLEEITREVAHGRRLRSEVRLGLFHFEQTFALAVAAPDGGRTRVGLRITTPSETPLLGGNLDRFAVRRLATDLGADALDALRAWCEGSASQAREERL